MKRPLDYAPKLAQKLSKSMVRGDPVRSIVELMTNSDDSLARINKMDGRITVHFKRGISSTQYLVFDNAEGMTQDKMNHAVGGYGYETSGFKEGLKVRGLFGRGLKEAILGLGKGIVESIFDGTFYKCSLDEEGYESCDPRKAEQDDYNRLLLNAGENGTLVQVEIDNKAKNIRIPRFDRLKTALQKHVSLRDIMTNPQRKVVLEDINQNVVESLTYKYPSGKEIYSAENIQLPGYLDAKMDIQLFRADEELSQIEEGYMRDGGLLIRSGRAIHDATLFRFDNNKYARRFYGNLRCEYLDELINEEEPVISDKRDGLETAHPFIEILVQITEGILEPFVKKEQKEEEANLKELETSQTKKRFVKTIAELNHIAKAELKEIEGPVKIEETTTIQTSPIPPLALFQFSTNYAQIISGKKDTLYLKSAVPEYLPNGTSVTVTSNNEEVKITTPEFVLNEDQAENGVITSKIIVEGRQVGAKATITATAKTFQTSMLVKVISKKEHKPSTPKPPKAGLFKGIRFNDVDNPSQRAYFDKNTGIIDIYTKSESVAMYLGPHGEDQEKWHCQVLEAELITDVYCRFLAKQMEEKGLLLIPSESARLDAIDNAHENLRGKYAAVIHKCLVDSAARRGLLPIQETLEVLVHD